MMTMLCKVYNDDYVVRYTMMSMLCEVCNDDHVV